MARSPAPVSLAYIGEDAFALCPNLCLIVCAGSYAEAYATENDIPHIQAAP